MDLCPICLGLLKTKEGAYSSELGTNKVIFTQLKACDNKQCSNCDVVIDTVKHEMN